MKKSGSMEQSTNVDFLLQEMPFECEEVFFPLGFPLRIRSNSPLVLEAAKAGWRKFPQSFDRKPLELSLGVSDSDSSSIPPLPLFRARRQLMSVTADRENYVVCDFATGFGFGWVTPAVLADSDYFRFALLEAAGYSLIAERHLAPVHAACVAFNGRGILLCGPSEAGKSSFAYACARQGWTYISDDGSFLVRSDSGHTVVGNPYRMRFRASALTLFPELSTHLARTRPNGKVSIEVQTEDLPGIAIAPNASVQHVVFLKREPAGPARILALSKDEAFRRLRSGVSLGNDQSKREQTQALWNLLVNDPLELAYAEFPSAIASLESLLSPVLRNEPSHS